MKTAIDWSTRTTPWRSIGPEFKAEVESITPHRTPAVRPLKYGPPLPLPRRYRGKQ